MPPKKEGPSKKSVDKAKTKIVEDKTFGMKNKNKSKKVQEYVKQVTTQVKGNEDQKKFEAKQKKKEEEERLKFEKEIFKPAAETKVPVGVSPKSILCELFKIGMCTKGDKCKYSHNVAVTRKSEKIDIYTDKRDKETDTMDKWDTEKLESVVGSKEGQQANKTDIVCKYFIEAIEKRLYGWFWVCPNGGDKCMYRHALPPGFVLKSQLKKEDLEEDEGETLEDQLEAERAKLTKRTPLTKELFLKWKEDKKKEREAKAELDKAQREKDIKQGRAHRSGREIFVANPDLFTDDLDADVFDIADLPEQEDDVPVIEIDVSGTSIRTRVTGGKQEEGEEDEEGEGEGGIQEDLFVEDDIPDVSDDEDS